MIVYLSDFRLRFDQQKRVFAPKGWIFDVRPYICLLPICSDKLALSFSRAETSHSNSVHYCRWKRVHHNTELKKKRLRSHARALPEDFEGHVVSVQVLYMIDCLLNDCDLIVFCQMTLKHNGLSNPVQ